MGALLLACAGSAFAGRTVYVEAVTVKTSELNVPTPLTADDVVIVRNNGAFWVDSDATIGSLQIGDGNSYGQVLFGGVDQVGRTLNVSIGNGTAGDVTFGTFAGPGTGNILNMAYLSQGSPHLLRLQGTFLASGNGQFSAGAGTIEYCKAGAQNVSAKIGGSGATIQYKHLILSGSPAAPAVATKTFPSDASVSVQGFLTITEKAQVAGNPAFPVVYGSLARLYYTGSQAQTTSAIEWPSPVGGLALPIFIANSQGVTLDGDKNVAAGGYLTLNNGCNVTIPQGVTLTAQCSIANAAAFVGKGMLRLDGASALALSGAGSYGNVTVANTAGITLSSSAAAVPPMFAGRLTILGTAGKVKIPAGMNHTASLLTYKGADKPNSTYGPQNGVPVPGTPDNEVFFYSTSDLGFTGILTVPVKPTAVIAVNGSAPVITYGDQTVTVSGTVRAPAGPPNFADYGNETVFNATPNETVTVTISPPGITPISQTVAIGPNNTFSATLSTVGLPATALPTPPGPNPPHPIAVAYSGGINLASASLNPFPSSGLTIRQKLIIVNAINIGKYYGELDTDKWPNGYPYELDPSTQLIPPDSFTGKLARTAGENVGGYAINQGNLALSLNYELHFNVGKSLTIIQRPLMVTPSQGQGKTYGTEPDPSPLTYTLTFAPNGIKDPSKPALIGTDAITPGTALARNPGKNAGQYPITLGNLSAGFNYILTIDPATVNFTISPLAITVNFYDGTKVYGEGDPVAAAPSVDIYRIRSIVQTANPSLNGLQYGDYYTPAGKGAIRTSGQNVGTYPISITNNFTIKDSANNAIMGNYSITYEQGRALTITERPVEVYAQTVTKVYGQTINNSDKWRYEAKSTGRGLILPNGQNGVPGQTELNPLPQAVFPGGAPVQYSLPGPYAFTINVTAAEADPNYDPNVTPGNETGTLTISKAPLSITAENKTKVGDNAIFNPRDFTVTYNTFLGTDNVQNSFDPNGELDFTGAAVTATDPGVYKIHPNGLTSPKYDITWVDGWLVITETPHKTDVTGPITWTGTATVGGTSNLTFFINKGDGSAGNSQGWSLLNITGQLAINSTPADPFRVDLVTLAGNVAGLMARFDPTRPYVQKWEFVRASGGITGFNAANFTLNWQAAANGGFNLFQNPIFGGQFRIAQYGNSLYIEFNPVGIIAGNPPVVGTYPYTGYDVGTTSDTTTLLGNCVHSPDVDCLYLFAEQTSINSADPQGVTIDLNVDNLKQPIIGAEAYIAFSSSQFKTGAAGTPGAPEVTPGGGVWDTLITKVWNTSGELDTVIAVNLQTGAGTTAGATLAKIKLTPTKTFTGKTRVEFRKDGALGVDGQPHQTQLAPATVGAAAVLPSRVMSQIITVATDAQGPTLSWGNINQVQPHSTSAVNVKSQAAPAVRTAGAAGTPTFSGPVVINLTATDAPGAAAVGLAGAPTVTVTGPGGFIRTATCQNPGTVGPFVYNLAIDNNWPNGSYSMTAVGADTIIPANTTTLTTANMLTVNTIEITGVVELQSFKGTNRTVTFKTGDGVAPSSDVKTWTPTLNFISGPILSSSTTLSSGAFQQRSAMVARLLNPTAADPTSVWLRYGDITDLAGLALKIKGQVGGVATLIHQLLYGEIVNLPTLVAQLTNPTRAVDTYIVSRLSNQTIIDLAAYVAAPTPANAAKVKQELLDDFNTIVLGASIYDPVRFASVPLNATTASLIPDQPAGPQRQLLNRMLLFDTFLLNVPGTPPVPTYTYAMGQLRPETAQQLSAYTSGSNPTLKTSLLQDFETLTINNVLWPAPMPGMWPAPTAPYYQCLYNETMFLGVTLTSPTLTLLNQHKAPGAPLTDGQLTSLNQNLLRDAFPGLYQIAPLTPSTVIAIKAYNAGDAGTFMAVENGLTTDMNALINSGASIYTSDRFAGYYIDPASELGQLMVSGSNRVRENRLLFELAYDTEMAKSVLAVYRLVGVPSSATQVSAKTDFSLRVLKGPYVMSTTTATVANFVNDGVPTSTGALGWTAGSDFYLRGGDLQGDNAVSLFDYNALRIGIQNPPGLSADINGDGRADAGPDYNILASNWAKTGDADVQ